MQGSGSSGWQEVHLSLGHFLLANRPLSPGAGGGNRPDQGRGRRRSSVQSTGRPDGTGRCLVGQCPPGEGKTPEGPARRGALDRTLKPLPASTLTLGPQERPLHFLHRADPAGLLRAMTSSKPGTTSSTCPARATAPLPAPPPRGLPAPPPAAAISAYPSLPPPSGAAPWRSRCTSNQPESELARPTPPPPPPGHAQVPPTVPPPGPGHTPGHARSHWSHTPTPTQAGLLGVRAPGAETQHTRPEPSAQPRSAACPPPSPASVSPPVRWGQFVP